MDDFSYLSVLVSIVLGLGITNLLTGLATLVRRRARIKPYWPTPVWIVTLFLIHVQTWWSMFAMRGVRGWNFGATQRLNRWALWEGHWLEEREPNATTAFSTGISRRLC